MIKIKLTQKAYIDSYGFYTANAIDDNGNKYEVMWSVTINDEPNCSDWNIYDVIDLSNNKYIDAVII